MITKYILLLILTLPFTNIRAQGLDELIAKKEYSKAVNTCNELLEIPNMSKATATLCSKAYNQQYNYRNSLIIINKALKASPKDFDLLLNRATAFNGIGNYNYASIDLQNLIHYYPNKSDLHNYLGRTLYTSKRVPALFSILTSLILAPNSTYATENISYTKELFRRNNTAREAKNPMSNVSSLSSNKIKSTFNTNYISHLDFELSVLAAVDENTDFKNDLEYFESKLFFLGKTLNESEVGNDFFWQKYSNYYIELYKRKYTEVAANYILQNSQLGCKKWLQNNPQKLNEFLVFTSQYNF